MPPEQDYDFRGRRQNERVLLIAKYHPWLLMPIVLIWIVLLLILGLVVWKFGASLVSSLTIVVIVIGGGFYTGYQWFLWNAGTYIITNQRVIKIEQISLFNRQIAEAEIDRIQEISTEISGPIHTLFNFGTVRIQTASNTGRIDLQDVTDPYDIQQEIVRVQRLGAEHKPTTVNEPVR